MASETCDPVCKKRQIKLTKENDMQFFEKLHISTVADDAAELAAANNIGLEIAEFCTAFNMDIDFETWDNIVIQKMEKTSAGFVFHAPFNELCPAAIDPMIIEVAKKRYVQTYELMKKYKINKMVVHSGNVPRLYHDSWFFEHSVAFWKEFIADKPDDFSVCIENLFEVTPTLLCEIVEEVADERLKLCLDVGHAALFTEKMSLNDWIDRCATNIGHLHLHNNEGKDDTHSALDDGLIDISEIISRVSDIAPRATFTIESIDATRSIDWLIKSKLI